MSFGFGIGDIINACQTIYIYAKRYKDARGEFEEICEKAKSLEVTLRRIDTELLTKGNIVERSEDPAFIQLEDNLKSLRLDAKNLAALVVKYDFIHHEGFGRRLLFSFKESGDLTDLRRRIGLHEQTLQLWYMTIVMGSLRRIEGGIDDIKEQLKEQLKAMGAIRSWGPSLQRQIRDSVMSRSNSHKPPANITAMNQANLGHNIHSFSRPSKLAQEKIHATHSKPDELTVTEKDSEPLKKALRDSGLSEAEIDASWETAVQYLFAQPEKQQSMEFKVEEQLLTEMRKPESNSTSRPNIRNPGYKTQPSVIKPLQRHQDELYDIDRTVIRSNHPIYRSKSANSRPKPIIKLVPTDEETLQKMNLTEERRRSQPGMNSLAIPREREEEIRFRRMSDSSAGPSRSAPRNPYVERLNVPEPGLYQHRRARSVGSSSDSDVEEIIMSHPGPRRPSPRSGPVEVERRASRSPSPAARSDRSDGSRIIRYVVKRETED